MGDDHFYQVGTQDITRIFKKFQSFKLLEMLDLLNISGEDQFIPGLDSFIGCDG